MGLTLPLITMSVVLSLEPESRVQVPRVEPTLLVQTYTLPQSGNCQECHSDQVALSQAGADSDELARLAIEPESLRTPHGRLACVTCHLGTGSTEDVDAAHAGVIADPSRDHSGRCVSCHYDLPDEFPQDRLRTPHNEVAHGQAVEVSCSDCHGGVGHGFDPVSGEVICPMGVCLDCHQTRQLDSELSDCSVCHTGPHDAAVAVTMECSTCHQSTDVWQEVELAVHPVELAGKHAEAQCFDCHQEPNFQGLQYTCSNCHQRPHDFGNDDCAKCHNPAADWKVAEVSGDHPFPQDHNGANGGCNLCHPDGDITTYSCEICHSESGLQVHKAQGMKDIAGKCMLCHPQGQKP